MQAYAFGERVDQVARCPLVDGCALTAMQPDARGERPRAGDLDLEATGPAVEGLGKLVEVLLEEGSSAVRVGAGPVDEAPSRRLEVDGQVDEQAGCPPDHVGARPPVGQLRQVGKPSDLAVSGRVGAPAKGVANHS